MFGVSFAFDVDYAKYSGGNHSMQEERLRMVNAEEVHRIDDIQDASES